MAFLLPITKLLPKFSTSISNIFSGQIPFFWKTMDCLLLQAKQNDIVINTFIYRIYIRMSMAFICSWKELYYKRNTHLLHINFKPVSRYKKYLSVYHVDDLWKLHTLLIRKGWWCYQPGAVYLLYFFIFEIRISFNHCVICCSDASSNLCNITNKCTASGKRISL